MIRDRSLVRHDDAHEGIPRLCAAPVELVLCLFALYDCGGAMFLIHNPQHVTRKESSSLARKLPRGLWTRKKKKRFNYDHQIKAGHTRYDGVGAWSQSLPFDVL